MVGDMAEFGNRSEDGEAVPERFGPWNPGLSSVLPRKYLPYSTMFREENVTTSIEEAHEISEFCGLLPHECVAFRAERLIIHEVLIRVTADLSVYTGRQYEDLGINFRRIVATILDEHVAPHQQSLCNLHDDNCLKIERAIKRELEATLFAPRSSATDVDEPASIWNRMFGPREPNTIQPEKSPVDDLHGLFERWRSRRSQTNDALEASVLEALLRVVKGITGRHGRVVGDIGLLTSIAGKLVSNSFGARALSEAIDPIFRKAVAAEALSLLPAQAEPMVLNVKGASASGKSTMRPHQQRLVERINVDWSDFALISPDIWRKYLLDYDVLGPAYKYAGMMAGHEVEIIDRKLDLYMARKAAAGAMTHLLIDRFRFDSFVPDRDAEEHVRLLTRFGDLVYMFFMITAPDATVERAWRRGQLVGRYKAVDDLLGHNVEAFSGMPELFFTWAMRNDKRVHYEFLDNSVPFGSLPKTIAFGWNGEMNILDVKGILDIDRFRKINVDARRPEEVHQGHSMAPEDNTEFLRRCAKMIPTINFADQYTGKVYAQMENGNWLWRDEQALELQLRNPDVRAGLLSLGLSDVSIWPHTQVRTVQLVQREAHTLGAWSENAQIPVAGNFRR
jgi:hypothetical protein